jgi:purine-binding chemotaxis protein CheW
VDQTGKYITFQISGRYFALPMDRVREMMPMQPLESWFANEDGLTGVLHTRGRVIPIFDVRKDLGLPARHSCRQERLIIVKSHDGCEFGFAVDKITDCINVDECDIRNSIISGHGRARTILNPDKVVDQQRLFATTFASNSASKE